MDRYEISGDGFRASVKTMGAELCSLTDASGREFLWQGGAIWPRQAPNLFPIVGRLKGDILRYRGREYRMNQHGFARDRVFACIEHTATACRFQLRESEATRALYPFRFLFEVAYRIEGKALSIAFTVTNTGDDLLPASMGAHPGLRWPLVDDVPKEDHFLVFSRPETTPTRRLKDGLLLPGDFPPVGNDRVLKLREDIFARDAVIIEKVASRRAIYGIAGETALDVSWDEGFPSLALWSRSGGDFLCIEPWHGFSSPTDFDGDITEKPGIMLIPSGARRGASYAISLRKDFRPGDAA